MKEKLIELLEDLGATCDVPIKADEKGCGTYDIMGADYIADHLIANGVIALPCKIGDEFWTDWVGITKVKCSMLTQKADGSWKGRFSVDNGWGSSVNVSLDEIGKTLFLTKEEAEAAIEERRNDV